MDFKIYDALINNIGVEQFSGLNVLNDTIKNQNNGIEKMFVLMKNLDIGKQLENQESSYGKMYDFMNELGIGQNVNIII